MTPTDPKRTFGSFASFHHESEANVSCTFHAIAARTPDLQKCDSETLGRIRSDFAFLPNEYVQFLVSVGWGEVAGLMFYSEPMELNEIFGKDTAETSAEIVLIGDDMAGGHLGYIKVGNEWSLTDFDHTDLPGHPSPSDLSLSEYIMARLA